MRARTLGFVCLSGSLFVSLTVGCSTSSGGTPSSSSPDDGGQTATQKNPGNGATGAGGLGGDDSSPGIVGCGITNLNATCNTCLQASCCTAAQACASDSACTNLVACLAGAPFTDGGVQACDDAAGATAQEEYGTFQSCLQTTCSASCASCHGIPASCSGQLDEVSCSSVGCQWLGTCTGTSLGCLDLDQFQCGFTLGCYYDSTAMLCSGSTPSCDSNTTQIGCTNETGCTWMAGCTGVSSVLCDAQTTQSACINAGCLWN